METQLSFIILLDKIHLQHTEYNSSCKISIY